MGPESLDRLSYSTPGWMVWMVWLDPVAAGQCCIWNLRVMAEMHVAIPQLLGNIHIAAMIGRFSDQVSKMMYTKQNMYLPYNCTD